MRHVDRDWYELSTGKRFYANFGVIGIGERDGKCFIREGYDGRIMELERDDPDGWEEDAFDLTPAERQEIAAYMAERWGAWAKQG